MPQDNLPLPFLNIAGDLQGALETGNGLRVAFQPLVETVSRETVGLEALVRWQHPTRGLVSPDAFIPAAEETGLITPLGEWVLQQACAVSLRRPSLFVAINVSPAQLRSGDFVEQAIRTTRESGADPRNIELEITERIALEDNSGTRNALRGLRRAGFRIALDDFGTGYSDPGYLRQFEVDKIKVDRSFVQRLNQTSDAAAILHRMVSLGRSWGLTVTAEGVETEDQMQLVARMGCDEMQGFLFSHPIAKDEIFDLACADRAISSRSRPILAA